VRIELAARGADGAWRTVKTVVTNADGRTDQPLMIGDDFRTGVFRLTFHAGDYFRARGVAMPSPAFVDVVPLEFGIAETDGHYHVPLLVSPWSYSTYRGS
jgi:5-hydroxyisourate hydrolase